MTRVLIFGLAAAIVIIDAGGVAAADAEAATRRAQTVCAGCHGPEGVSVNPLYPNLAGQQQEYLAKAMKDYRDGARSDTLMTPMSQGLTDQEIEDLAAYFSALGRGG